MHGWVKDNCTTTPLNLTGVERVQSLTFSTKFDFRSCQKFDWRIYMIFSAMLGVVECPTFPKLGGSPSVTLAENNVELGFQTTLIAGFPLTVPHVPGLTVAERKWPTLPPPTKELLVSSLPTETVNKKQKIDLWVHYDKKFKQHRCNVEIRALADAVPIQFVHRKAERPISKAQKKYYIVVPSSSSTIRCPITLLSFNHHRLSDVLLRCSAINIVTDSRISCYVAVLSSSSSTIGCHITLLSITTLLPSRSMVCVDFNDIYTLVTSYRKEVIEKRPIQYGNKDTRFDLDGYKDPDSWGEDAHKMPVKFYAPVEKQTKLEIYFRELTFAPWCRVGRDPPFLLSLRKQYVLVSRRAQAVICKVVPPNVNTRERGDLLPGSVRRHLLKFPPHYTPPINIQSEKLLLNFVKREIISTPLMATIPEGHVQLVAVVTGNTDELKKLFFIWKCPAFCSKPIINLNKSEIELPSSSLLPSVSFQQSPSSLLPVTASHFQTKISRDTYPKFFGEKIINYFSKMYRSM
ncbi:hypothetical protein GQR58_019844 [Nymphon striatum]|nr:hypothetical protein GQR58_019844 [Nymphon striatum]